MFKNKIIQLFLMLGVILLGLACVGCNNSKEKVNIDFRMGTESEIVTVDKGTMITKDILPFKDNLENIELYYDDKKSEKYNDEPIHEDITIYAYIKIEISEEQIKEDYLRYAHLNGKQNLTIEDIQILNHYGQYDDVVIVRMNRETLPFIRTISFLDDDGSSIDIEFLNTNTPLVYKEGNFYELKDAYNKEGIITRETLIQLKSKIEDQNKGNKVNITFKMGTETEIIPVEKGTPITKYIFPFTGSLKNIELYYDDNKVKKYNDEPIQEDITIYAYMKGQGEIEITEEQIREDYLRYAHLHGKENLTIDDIKISDNYGQYGDVVIVRMSFLAPQIIIPVIFGGGDGFYLRINFPNTNIPLVYKDGNFYKLEEAYYIEGIITRKALIQLKNQIEGSSKE